MPTRVDINDDERDTSKGAGTGADDEGEEGDEEEGKGGKGKGADDSAASTQAALARLTQTVQQLTNQVGAKSAAETKKEISKSEQAIAYLLQSGYKPEQLEALVTFVAAAKEDIEAGVDAKVAKRTEDKEKQSLDQQCYTRASEVLDKLLEGTDVAGDEDYRDMLTKKMQRLMEKDEAFEGARASYMSQKPPSSKDFEKAARLVLQKLGKESAMNSRDNNSPPPQLDVKNSRSKSHPAVSKNGEVDLDKLSDYEREVYTVAWNSTKSKEVALHALQTVGQLKR